VAITFVFLREYLDMINDNETNSQQSLSPLTLEHSLAQLVVKVKEEIGCRDKTESECSVYLHDFRRNCYVLRASTKPTLYLGIEELVITSELKNRFDENKVKGIGLTNYVVLLGKTSYFNNITENETYSCYGKTQEELTEWEGDHYCEYTHKEISSMLAAPFYLSDDPQEKSTISKREMPDGIIRLVRKKKITGTDILFSDRDVKDIDSIIENERVWMQSCAFVSQLIELGTYTDIVSLCRQAAFVFRNLLGGKGCSIFLMDEIETEKQKDNTLYYKCYGSTGLVIRDEGDSQITRIKDPLVSTEAWYTLKRSDMQPNSNTPPPLSLTMGVVRARTCCFIDDIYAEDFLSQAFPKKWAICREPGIGKVCESYVLNDEYQPAESILIAPMFYREPLNQSIDVLGIVRIVRPIHTKFFSSFEKHLFVSLVERLAKAIISLRFREFIDKLASIDNRELLSHYLVNNVPKFTSANICFLYKRINDKLCKLDEWRCNTELHDHASKIKTHQTKLVQKVIVLEETIVKDLNDKQPIQFVGIPIKSKDATGKPLGVLGIWRDIQLTPPGNDDSITLERIAGHLSGKMTEFFIRDKRQRAIELIIPSVLRSQIEKLSRLTCREILQEFIGQLHTFDNLEDAIVDFFPRLLEHYESSDTLKSVRAWHLFQIFNKKILSSTPRYRDHFVHQFVVFLLGVVMLDRLDTVPVSTNCYPGYQNLSDREKMLKMEQSWMMTSLFHDVAYPLQTSNKWFWDILRVFIGEDSHHPTRDLPLDTILFNPDYLDSIDQLLSFHLQLARNEHDLRRFIMDVLRNRDENGTGMDHGIMGALLLLSNPSFEFEAIAPVASAIALHNTLSDGIAGVDMIHFEKHPLAFILIFCDLLHEWARDFDGDKTARDTKFHRLKNFVITTSFDELREHGLFDGDLQLTKQEIKKMGYFVYASIQIGQPIYQKLNEARRKFDRLNSENVCFIIKINNRTIFIPH
jgi:hypothetical protein